MLLVAKTFGALPYLVELLLLGGILAWLVRRLMRALKISHQQLFRTAVWMSGLNIAYGLSMFMLLLPEFFSPINHEHRDTVNNLISIFIGSFAMHLIILAEFFIYLYLKQAYPKRSLLMAALNLSPFLIAFVGILILVRM